MRSGINSAFISCGSRSVADVSFPCVNKYHSTSSKIYVHVHYTKDFSLFATQNIYSSIVTNSQCCTRTQHVFSRSHAESANVTRGGKYTYRWTKGFNSDLEITRTRSKVGKPGESSQVFPLLTRRGALKG